MGRGDSPGRVLSWYWWLGVDWFGVGSTSSSCASISTTTIAADVLEESDESEPEYGPGVHAEDPISNRGDGFGDWSCWSVICSRLVPYYLVACCVLDSRGHLEPCWLYILFQICNALSGILIYSPLHGI